MKHKLKNIDDLDNIELSTFEKQKDIILVSPENFMRKRSLKRTLNLFMMMDMPIMEIIKIILTAVTIPFLVFISFKVGGL